ncbi:hypothetical protein CsSME_00017321 [Camellia sinensis var. sinensis]
MNGTGSKEEGVKMEDTNETVVLMWGYLPGASPDQSQLLSPETVWFPPTNIAGDSWKDACGGGCGFAMAISVECGQTWPRRQAIKLARKAYRIRVMFLRRRKAATEKQLLAVAEIVGIEVEVAGYMMGHMAAEQQWGLKTSNIKAGNSKLERSSNKFITLIALGVT